MAVQSSFKNMVLCLLGICLVCSGLLAGMYALTKKPIDEAAKKKISSAIANVLPEFGGTPELKAVEADGKEYSYYKVSKDGEIVGYAIQTSASGFGGAISLMVGITAGGEIYNCSVLSHSETPGLGAKCTDETFAGQFRGFDPAVKTLKVKKDGGDVDAITASTITSRAYCKALENAVAAYRAIAASEAATLPLPPGAIFVMPVPENDCAGCAGQNPENEQQNKEEE